MNNEKIESQSMVVKGKCKEGYFGHVYFFPEGRATKIFKRQKDEDDEYVHKVFSSEVEAYKIVSEVEELRIITPTFFDKVDVSKVIDCNGNDISWKYLLECAYQMEYIDGEFIKVGYYLSRELRKQYEYIRELFCSHGIFYTKDASVLIDPESQKIKYVIDFSTWDPKKATKDLADSHL